MSNKMEAFVHGGNIYDTEGKGQQWLDFSANINPLGMPATVKQAIKRNLDELVHYPDPQGRLLKRSIADWHRVDREQVVLGNGAAELFYVYFHFLCPKRVLLPVPSFSEYEKAARAAGAEIRYFYLQAEEDFRLDFVKLAKELQGCQAVVLGNPNNPTGTMWQRDELKVLLDAAAELDVTIMVDESFLGFLQEQAAYSVAEWTGTYRNLIVISSLTKVLAIPGLRLGYGIANEALVKELEFQKDTWNVNSLAQAAGVAGLGDKQFLQATWQHTTETVAHIYRCLSGIPGLRVYKPMVNFVLLGLQDCGITGRELTARMRERGILIRDCSNYPGLDEYYVRVAVRGLEENNRMLAALSYCLLN